MKRLVLTSPLRVDNLPEVSWLRTASTPNNLETGTTLEKNESAVRGLFAFGEDVLSVTAGNNWSYDDVRVASPAHPIDKPPMGFSDGRLAVSLGASPGCVNQTRRGCGRSGV